jgi:hypothetical protein
MPIVSIPIVGQMNYFQNGHGDGTIVLILGALSAVAVAAQKYQALWITGLGSLGVLAYTFFNFESKISDAKASMGTQLEGNPFRGLADAMIGTVQLQWGWGVLVVGAIMVLAAANMKPSVVN